MSRWSQMYCMCDLRSTPTTKMVAGLVVTHQQAHCICGPAYSRKDGLLFGRQPDEGGLHLHGV